KIKTAPRVNCNLSNNKVFYFSLHKINKSLSLKNNPLAFEYIHRKNKFNIFIQIPFLSLHWRHLFDDALNAKHFFK
ncbi:hypothetical protein CKJ90_31820, partial [Klebsiella pneumoniae]